MKKHIILLIAIALGAAPLCAQTIGSLPSASAMGDTDLFMVDQASNSATYVQMTGLQIKTYAQTGMVPTSRTVNGHALTGSVTVTPSDLSLVIGTNVEAWNAKLDALAALSPPGTSGEILSSSSSGTLSWIPPVLTATASGTNIYTATPSPALSAYTTGLSAIITFTNANTGGASLNLNSLGSVPILQNGAPVAAGQIPAGSTLHLVYDGTNFDIVGNDAGGSFAWTGITGKPTTVAGYGITNALVTTNNLSDVNSASTARTNLGLAIGTNVEAWNTNLDTLAANTPNTDSGAAIYNSGGNLSILSGGGLYDATASLGTSAQVLTIDATTGLPTWEAVGAGSISLDSSITAAGFSITSGTIFLSGTNAAGGLAQFASDGSIKFEGATDSGSYSVTIGHSSSAYNGGVAIGSGASATAGGEGGPNIAIGPNASATNVGVAIGSGAQASGGGVCFTTGGDIYNYSGNGMFFNTKEFLDNSGNVDGTITGTVNSTAQITGPSINIGSSQIADGTYSVGGGPGSITILNGVISAIY